jgi:hypothetical protein
MDSASITPPGQGRQPLAGARGQAKGQVESPVAQLAGGVLGVLQLPDAFLDRVAIGHELPPGSSGRSIRAV